MEKIRPHDSQPTRFDLILDKFSTFFSKLIGQSYAVVVWLTLWRHLDCAIK